MSTPITFTTKVPYGTLNENFLRANLGNYSLAIDGNVVISADTTLYRDMYYDTLTVNAVLNTNGFRIFANTITGNNSGKIKGVTGNDGGDGGAGVSSPLTDGVAGVGGASSGSFFKTTPGGDGGVVTGVFGSGFQYAGQGTPATVYSMLGVTTSSGGTHIYANGSSSGQSPTHNFDFLKFSHLLLNGFDVISGQYYKWFPQPSAPGGAGGARKDSGSGNACGGGGGGGASGGLVFIWCKYWSGSFSIESIGGNGGDGGNYASGSRWSMGGSGGAGGNGGTAVVVYAQKSWTGSYILTGGNGGNKGTSDGPSTASNGNNGATGSYYEILAQSLIR